MGKLCLDSDGKTASRYRVDPEGACVPGCYNNTPDWCPDENRWWHCNGYPPDRLDQMLRVQLAHKPDHYNEVVFDAWRLAWWWPAGIEAVVYPAASSVATRTQAEDVWRSYRAAYGEAATGGVALLQFDLSEAAGDAPFSVPSR